MNAPVSAPLKYGTTITIHGEKAFLKTFNKNKRQIEIDTQDGINDVMPMSTFFELYSSGKIQLHGDGFNEQLAQMGPDEKLGPLLLTAVEQSVIERRLAYIETATTTTGLWEQNATERKQAASSYAAESNDANPPCDGAIRRWYTRYTKAKNDLRSLLPRTKERGNRSARLSDVVSALMEEVIHTYYLNTDRLSGKNVYNYRLMVRLQQMNVPRADWPTYKTFIKTIKKYPEYLKTSKRFGYHEAFNKFPNGRPFPKAAFPLERVEIDHTPMDINVIDSDGKVLGRVYVTFLIDCYTRMVVGLYVSKTPVTRRNVLHAVIHSILPKDYIKTAYPSVVNDWPCFGLYTELVSDNGLDLVARDVRAAVYNLGINYRQNPKKSPRLKPKVERFNGTVSQVLLHQMPGTTFSNYVEKKDYKTSEKACITFEKLVELIHWWVVDIYHVETHRTLNDSPLNVWKKSIKNFQPPVLPRSSEILNRILTEPAERALQRYGVEIFGLKYNSEGLMNIARKKNFSGKLRLLYNPDNIAKLEVLDPDTNVYVEASCVNEAYTNGFLSLDDHNAAKAAARKAAGENRQLTERDLIKARAGIMAEIDKSKVLNGQKPKKTSKLHKHDPERKKTSSSVNGSDTVANTKTNATLNDESISGTITLDFEAF